MKNKTMMILIISIIGLTVLFGGISYAYLRSTITQSSQNEVSTLNCLSISMSDITSAITLTNAYPISDEKGLMTTPYSFTITNNCATPVAVQINLESLNIENKLATNYVKFNLDNGVGHITNLLSSQPTKTATISGATSNNLDGIFLSAAGTEDSSMNFNLRLWVNEATTLAQGSGKTYQGKIVAVASPLITYEPSFDGNSDTLLYALKNGNYLYTDPITMPGKAISSSSEAVIARTADDYGISYYFRGKVENNYVVFAKMCWRIVRIDGLGNIKLVLYNYNSDKENITNPCSPDYDGTSNAFARYSGTTYTTKFNDYSNYNAYIGLMYGTPNSSTYALEHANNNKSRILTNLETWYENNLAYYESSLADVIWCNAKSTDGDGYGKKFSFYRYNYVYNKKPSLICPNDKDGGKLSKFTVNDVTNGNGDLDYKVGLLTADEVVFAGSCVGSSCANTSYYLYKNASSDYWWTMSPSYFNNSDCIMYFVALNSNLDNYNSNALYALRPAISLTSAITIQDGGTGTQNNPYVVQ